MRFVSKLYHVKAKRLLLIEPHRHIIVDLEFVFIATTGTQVELWLLKSTLCIKPVYSCSLQRNYILINTSFYGVMLF